MTILSLTDSNACTKYSFVPLGTKISSSESHLSKILDPNSSGLPLNVTVLSSEQQLNAKLWSFLRDLGSTTSFNPVYLNALSPIYSTQSVNLKSFRL
mgnify:CR=1 FL=1